MIIFKKPSFLVREVEKWGGRGGQNGKKDRLLVNYNNT